MEYNTQRPKLVTSEYGRIIQKMAEHLLTITDRDKRTTSAKQIVEIIMTFNPQFKQVEEYRHKLWDYLYIITDFKLDVDAPYPKPDPAIIAQVRPDPLPYPRQNIKFRNYGKNLEKVIEKVKEIEEPEKRKGAAETIAYYMKLVHLQWNNENPSDELIKSDLKMLTNGTLEIDGTFNLDNIKGRPASEGSSYRDKTMARPGYKKGFKKGGQRSNSSAPLNRFRKKR
jgi:hypothetical protein